MIATVKQGESISSERYKEKPKGRKRVVPRRECAARWGREGRAIRFYQREGFKILREGMDEATGEKDYEMTWRQE